MKEKLENTPINEENDSLLLQEDSVTEDKRSCFSLMPLKIMGKQKIYSMKEHKFWRIAIWLIYDFTSLRLLKEKLVPPPEESHPKPSSLLLWVLSIYFAAYGVASTRYENRFDRVVDRVTLVNALLGTEARMEALGRLSKIQREKLPLKPELSASIITNGSLVLSSLFGKEQINNEVRSLVIDTVENAKGNLNGVNLQKIDLQSADLKKAQLHSADLRLANISSANFREANLTEARLFGANLKNTIFWQANLSLVDLSESNFEGAQFAGAILHEADLYESKLNDADFSEADLRKADLEGASVINTNFAGTNFIGTNLENVDICQAKTLYKAILPKHIETKFKTKCPEKFIISDEETSSTTS